MARGLVEQVNSLMPTECDGCGRSRVSLSLPFRPSGDGLRGVPRRGGSTAFSRLGRGCCVARNRRRATRQSRGSEWPATFNLVYASRAPALAGIVWPLL